MLKKIFSLNANIRKILLTQLFTSIGYFTIIPYFAYYLVEYLHFSIAFAGFQMTLLLVGQYGTTLLGGMLSDRSGPAKVMAAGLIIQIMSYFLLALNPTQTWEISTITLAIGIGKSLYTPSAKKMALIYAGNIDQILLFSVRSTINNVGLAVGSLIGALSINVLPWLFFFSASFIQILAFILFSSFIFRDSIATPIYVKPVAENIWENFIILLTMKKFMILAFLYCGFHILYMQLEFTFPLEAAQRFSTIGISAIFLTNSVVVIFLQIPINVIFSKHFSPAFLLIIGYVFMAIGIFFLLPRMGMPIFSLAVALFTIGEIVVDPNIDALTGTSIPSRMHGSAFGLLGLFALLGGTLGNGVGAYLFRQGNSNNLWLIAGSFGILLALGSFILSRKLIIAYTGNVNQI